MLTVIGLVLFGGVATSPLQFWKVYGEPPLDTDVSAVSCTDVPLL
jgi:hypothetical protein